MTLAIFSYFQAKNYYAFGLFPIQFVFGAIFLSHHLSKSWRIYLKPVAMIVPIRLFILAAPMTYPIGSPEYHKEVIPDILT
jgi:hypothetical protein